MSEGNFDLEMEESDVVNANEHSKLVKAIGKLDKTQHIRKPCRDGISEIKSEFHLSHSSHSGNKVAVSDLINILQRTSEHADTGKKIKVAQQLNKTLPKPIEKHEAEKIKRTTGFEEVKKDLGKWDAVVARNRTVEHIKFPLNSETVDQKTNRKMSKFAIKSDLENDLDQLKSAQVEEEEEESFPMTISELIEHRKETARLRAKQSYKEAKARRQGKIKSKKFHRIQRKERIKQQLKDFEQLQKTDPEEALRKLEQLEKTRAQERVTLRHKSTGQWAKNKLVRAKYDKETRQQLAEQLAISRQLTQKQITEETESEEEKEDINQNALEQDPSNPWLPKTQDVTDFVSGYKKYWEERNKSDIANLADNKAEEDKNQSDTLGEYKHDENSIQNETGLKPAMKKTKLKISTTQWIVEDLSKGIKPTRIVKLESGNKSLGELFDQAERKLQKSVSNKLDLLKSRKNHVKHKNNRNNNGSNESYKDETKYLEFRKQKLRPEIDDEMDESTMFRNSIDNNNVVKNILLKSEIALNDENNSNTNLVINSNDKIDPNKFEAVKPKHLRSALPDVEIEGDHVDDDEDERKLTIAEAFEDDDIVAEFQQDKESEATKDKPKIEDLSLPGWGSWVGKNMKTPKRRRRMILKTAEVIPRKDDKKDNVIINENKSAKLRTHQVSELPFPFASVGDYEATLRAPIGNTFIPESAHRKLIKPSVVVKRGLIIDPMDESQLINKKKSKLAIKNSNDSTNDKPLFKKIAMVCVP